MTAALTASAFQRLQARMRGGLEPKKAKYGNKKVKGFDAAGATITFDSKREAKRWGELQTLAKAGEIADLQRQISFLFLIDDNPLTYKSGRKVKYVCDFAYANRKTGEWVYEDSKGFSTPDYKIKWALMRLFHGINVKET